MEKVKTVSNILEEELPSIIKNIAKRYGGSSYIKNQDFLEERLYSWHQFGLLTHTKKVREVFLNELKGFLEEWGIYNKFEKIMREKIQGIEKKTLFEISIPLHDLGKIICQGDKRTDRQHELASKELISKDPIKAKLREFGLLEDQIDYIKEVVENHDVVGKEIRDVLKHEGNLVLDYVSGENTIKICKKVAKKYANFKLEVGIFYLCDLLGKTEVRINSENEEKIETLLEEKSLRPELKKAVLQLPVNLKLAEIFLKNIFE